MNSSELKGYLTGLILGDGTIDKGITKRSFQIRSINKDFIDKIEEDLKSCTNFHIIRRYEAEHFSCGCNHKENWVLIIKAHPYFNKKYHYFYDDFRKRIITTESLKWLTPNGIANWYMSDGYICLVGKTKGVIRSRRMDICTDRYKKEDVQKISNYYNSIGIKTSLIKRDKFYRIRISKESYEKFIFMIYPYIVESMKYKLYLGYESQPKWMTNEMWNLQENLKSAIAQTDNAVG